MAKGRSQVQYTYDPDTDVLRIETRNAGPADAEVPVGENVLVQTQGGHLIGFTVFHFLDGGPQRLSKVIEAYRRN